MAYMNISCLEMERTRREKERSSAMLRIKNIDRRIKEIEAEKDLLLKRLGERTQVASREASERTSVAPQGKGGFKLRY